MATMKKLAGLLVGSKVSGKRTGSLPLMRVRHVDRLNTRTLILRNSPASSGYFSLSQYFQSCPLIHAYFPCKANFGAREWRASSTNVGF